MSRDLQIDRRAQKQLTTIPGPDRGGIIAAVRELAEQPRPEGGKKLNGREAWRIRVGNYRIIHEIHDEKLVVLIMAIGHRCDIYPNWNSRDNIRLNWTAQPRIGICLEISAPPVSLRLGPRE
jgi:mRNA interferase RelE/StbE